MGKRKALPEGFHQQCVVLVELILVGNRTVAVVIIGAKPNSRLDIGQFVTGQAMKHIGDPGRLLL